MNYKLVFDPRAWDELMALGEPLQTRIFDAIENLERHPRPAGCTKLIGRNGYRIRVGDYRVLYEIQDAVLVVTVVQVSRRDKAYKDKR